MMEDWNKFLNIKGFAAVIDDFAYTTDGVGQKLLLTDKFNKYDTIGIDLVAMCVNDLLCVGAKPIAFLDYYATGIFDIEKSKLILKSILKGCELAGCPLVGGETAIMPNVYSRYQYDLAGFAVGKVQKTIDVNSVKSGDYILGLPSSGIHSNGFTYIYSSTEEMLTPTKIYVKEVLSNLADIKSLAHITGGGIPENLPRALPEHLTYDIDIPYSDFFKRLFNKNYWDKNRFESIFNCGWGMLLISSTHIPETTILGKVVKK